MPRIAAVLILAGLVAAPAAAREPAPPLLTRVAFGSCADQDVPQPIWDAVLAYRPELFLFAGDNVYGDSRTDDLRELGAAYARTAAVEGYGRVRREVPHLATWDDHDYGANDAGGDFPGKERAKAVFLEFWGAAADDPRRSRGGVYDARAYGPEGRRVQVILLDTRYFRSPLRRAAGGAAVAGGGRYLPDEDPAKTLLGEEQWAWLAERLREPAELRLVVSSVQVLAEGHGWERWGNLPRERRRLYDLVRDTGARGVVFLSGDRHIAGVYETVEGVPYPLIELTSSGINKTYATPGDLQGNRVGAPYGRENFGTVDVDWRAGEVRLAVRGMGGEVVRERRVRLDALRPAGAEAPR